MHCSVSYQLTFCSVDLILPLIGNLPVKKENNNSDKKRNKTEQTLKLAVHCK